MQVRRACLEDEAAVIGLWRACELVVDYNDPGEDFRFAMGGLCSAVLLCEDEIGAVTGTVMVGHDGHRGWIYYLAADPDKQGTGIGRRLVEAAEQWLRDRGVRKVQLMIRETNTKVVQFYERLGFETTPRVVMAKWLRQ